MIGHKSEVLAWVTGDCIFFVCEWKRNENEKCGGDAMVTIWLESLHMMLWH